MGRLLRSSDRSDLFLHSHYRVVVSASVNSNVVGDVTALPNAQFAQLALPVVVTVLPTIVAFFELPPIHHQSGAFTKSVISEISKALDQIAKSSKVPSNHLAALSALLPKFNEC